MKNLRVLFVVFLLCLLTSAKPQDRPKFPQPPSSMDSDNAASASQPTASLQRRIDLVELQREADDLARTAQSIPADMASVRKGTLPKDIIQKLKQIEKLSKHLRTQISQ